jgi:hypothetical protein
MIDKELKPLIKWLNGSGYKTVASCFGTLWIVKKDMLAHPSHGESIGERLVQILKGEIFEWRYESDNHFRTMDNVWFWINDETLKSCCLKIGKINEDVSWKNIANTEEIWRLRLFSWIENGEEIYQRIKEETEVKVADGTPTTNDGIPPNNKLLGILPNEL